MALYKKSFIVAALCGVCFSSLVFAQTASGHEDPISTQQTPSSPATVKEAQRKANIHMIASLGRAVQTNPQFRSLSLKIFEAIESRKITMARGWLPQVQLRTSIEQTDSWSQLYMGERSGSGAPRNTPISQSYICQGDFVFVVRFRSRKP